MHQILDRKIAFSTPWFEIVAKTLAGCEAPYYAVKGADYVTVLATTEPGNVLLVRQYRPAVEEVTLELPSGHVEQGESAEEAARRELLEETGYVAGRMELLATLIPDSGRLGMRQWCYLASEAKPAATPCARETGVDALECAVSGLEAYIREGKFQHALHLAVVLLWRLSRRAGL